MPSKKKKRKEEDSDWEPQCAVKRNHNNHGNKKCVIHCCTDVKENLMALSSATCDKLLEAARIRNDEKVLKVLEKFRSEKNPSEIKYHNRCKKVYVHSGSLERLSKRRKVN